MEEGRGRNDEVEESFFGTEMKRWEEGRRRKEEVEASFFGNEMKGWEANFLGQEVLLRTELKVREEGFFGQKGKDEGRFFRK